MLAALSVILLFLGTPGNLQAIDGDIKIISGSFNSQNGIMVCECPGGQFKDCQCAIKL